MHLLIYINVINCRMAPGPRLSAPRATTFGCNSLLDSMGTLAGNADGQGHGAQVMGQLFREIGAALQVAWLARREEATVTALL